MFKDQSVYLNQVSLLICENRETTSRSFRALNCVIHQKISLLKGECKTFIVELGNACEPCWILFWNWNISHIFWLIIALTEIRDPSPICLSQYFYSFLLKDTLFFWFFLFVSQWVCFLPILFQSVIACLCFLSVSDPNPKVLNYFGLILQTPCEQHESKLQQFKAVFVYWEWCNIFPPRYRGAN